MLYGFVNAFISFKYQWTYIFIIRWISYGSHTLTYYYHCCFFSKMTQLFPGFCLRIYGFFIATYRHSNATSKDMLEWQWSVNLHICDALQCHSGVTLQCHSNATPKVHFNATPECTLHCHSITTTPMPLSHNTPMPLRSVFGVLICIFATHSYATPMPLQYHSIRSEWHRSVHSGLWK